MLDIKEVQQRLIDLTEEFREYVDLQQKPKSKLSKTARHRLERIEADLKTLLVPEQRSDFIYDAANIGKFFDVTPRSVQKWAKEKGCPKLRHGFYDLKAVHEWWLENIRGDGSSPDIDKARQEYWRWKAERERISVHQLQGQLIERSRVEEVLMNFAAYIKRHVFLLAKRLPGRLSGKKEPEIRSIIEDELCHIFETAAEQLSRQSEFVQHG